MSLACATDAAKRHIKMQDVIKANLKFLLKTPPGWIQSHTARIILADLRAFNLSCGMRREVQMYFVRCILTTLVRRWRIKRSAAYKLFRMAFMDWHRGTVFGVTQCRGDDARMCAMISPIAVMATTSALVVRPQAVYDIKSVCV